MAKNNDDQDDDKAAEGGEVKPLDDESGEGGGLNAKKLIMIIVPILLIGVGAALYFSGMFGGDAKPEGEVAAAASGEHGGDAAATGSSGDGTGQFLEIPDLLVNLAASGGQQRFLKLKVKLEVSSPEDLAKLEAVVPRVVDQFQTFLREIRVQDLRGSAGIYRLRQELLYRVNLAAQPVKVKDVLFQEMLVQ